MALITRVSRLFRADLHAVLDRIEEPELLLRQAVREMEEDLARDEQRIRLLQHEQGKLGTREAELEQSLQEIETELDLCFASAKEDLARTLVRRKLEAQRLGKHLAHQRTALRETLAGLTQRVEENRAQLEGMRQKAVLLAGEEHAAHGDAAWQAPQFPVCEADVEVAFLREQQKRSRS